MLGLLSQAADAGELPEEDAAVVRRRLPWARRLDELATDKSRALEEVARDRGEFVFKPLSDLAGADVHCGWALDESSWRAVLQACATRPYVVQHRVRPRGEPMPDAASGALGGMDSLGDPRIRPTMRRVGAPVGVVVHPRDAHRAESTNVRTGHIGSGGGHSQLYVVRLGEPADHLIVEAWHEGRGSTRRERR